MFTKELPSQTAVEISLWDIVLKSEQCDGCLPEDDRQQIKYLLSFFRQALLSSTVYKTSEVLNDLIDVLSDLVKSCNAELASKLLVATREFEATA